MATTEEIIAQAAQLGQLIAQHEAAKGLVSATAKLKSDPSATQAVQNFNRLLQNLGMKEQAGLPIEAAEKQQLEQLQQTVATNLSLRSFQAAQVAYVDFMRQVDEALTSAGPDPLAVPGDEAPKAAPAGGKLVY